jgi:hypothetical protein
MMLEICVRVNVKYGRNKNKPFLINQAEVYLVTGQV